MRENLEKYDKLITAFLVVIAFILAIGWWFAEEKSEPVYLSKIDRLMFDKDNKAPKFVLTLPDKITIQSKKMDEIVDDLVAKQPIENTIVADESFSVDNLLLEVPSVFNLPNKTPTSELDNVETLDELVETTATGMRLPKISEEGKRPWIEYGNSVKIQPNFKKVSLIISGVGFDENAAKKISSIFDSEISMSITPYATNPETIVAKARSNGHETYVDLLLSSRDFLKEDSGPLSITANLSREEVLRRFHKTISSASPLGGIVIRDGLINDNNKPMIQAILSEAKSRGLLIIDATKDNVVNGMKIKGLPRRRADIVIDKDASKDDIEDLLKKAENIAFDKGQVLIVTDTKPIIIKAIYQWINSFSPQVSYEEAKTVDITKPFALVPSSNLVVE